MTSACGMRRRTPRAVQARKDGTDSVIDFNLKCVIPDATNGAPGRALPWTNGLTPQTNSIVKCYEARLDIANKCLRSLGAIIGRLERAEI